MLYLKVDGEMSGTGIRNSVDGEFLTAKELGLSLALQKQIDDWVKCYTDCHYENYSDKGKVTELDREGLEICGKIQESKPDIKVGYYSSAYLKDIVL